MTALVILLDACGSEADRASLIGDGVLDCNEGQVVRSAEVEVLAESEHEVVAAALARWMDEGGSVVQLPADEAWSVVLGGREVAIAYPEIEGSGVWVVHDVRTCGQSETDPASIDGDLDCAGEAWWSIQTSRGQTDAGFPSAEEALRSALQPYVRRHRGATVLVGDWGSLVVGQREQVVAYATEVEAGGWDVATLVGCEGFD